MDIAAKRRANECADDARANAPTTREGMRGRRANDAPTMRERMRGRRANECADDARRPLSPDDGWF